MSCSTVAMVLSPAASSDLQVVPRGASAWVAATPEMQSTLLAARASGLAITELVPKRPLPLQQFFDHLDSLDQHHNELSQQSPYSELLVFGVFPSPEVNAWLGEFGFGPPTAQPFGLSASKNRATPTSRAAT